MKDVAFIVRRPAVASAVVRGRQVAAELGADLQRMKILDVALARKYRVLVYVKEIPPPAMLERIRDAGVIQVYDPLDNFRWRMIAQAGPYLDHFIGANHTHALELNRKTGVPATRLPHHHCNFDEVRIPAGRVPPTLGFVGGRDHWPESRRVVRRLEFPIFAHVTGDRTLVEAYSSIDVGFAYRVDLRKISWNSAVKLVNFMSFGIPSVLNPESGYLEISRHFEACAYGQTAAEFSMLLKHVAGDVALRRRMGDAGFEIARAYHLRHVADQYRALLESLHR